MGADELHEHAEQGHLEAQRELERAAQRGSIPAQLALARCHRRGLGVPRDAGLWRRWLEAAAALGSVEAELELGVADLDGEPGERNLAEAERWLRRAVGRGGLPAQFQLGRLLQLTNRAAEAVEQYRLALRLPEAMLALARCYDHGEGIGRDMIAALFYYRAAAAQRVPEAEYRVGVFAEAGVGAPPNFNEALLWYGRAAEFGHPHAIARRDEIRQRAQRRRNG